MFKVFQWLRDQARQAILAGVNDAVSELDQVDEGATPLAALRDRLAKLPASDQAKLVEDGRCNGSGKRKERV